MGCGVGADAGTDGARKPVAVPGRLTTGVEPRWFAGRGGTGVGAGLGALCAGARGRGWIGTGCWAC